MRYVLIPKGSEKPYQKVLLAWHTGIDAVETEIGFILNEEVLALFNNYPEKLSIKQALMGYPLKESKDIIFEREMIEP
jgi:hypothetical protein